jgi:hypothetical protein
MAAAVIVPAMVFVGVIAARYDGRPYLRGDCQYYYYTAVSLAEDFDLDLRNQLPPPMPRHDLDVALDQWGRLVPKHSMWMSLAALPLIVLFGPPGALIFNLTQLLLMLLLAYVLARRYASNGASAAAVILTATTSFLPHYVWNFSADLFVTTALIAGLVALPRDRRPSPWRHLVSGLLIGLSAVAKYSLVLAIPGLVLLVGRPFKKTLPAFAAGFAVPVLLAASLNFHLFGSPLVTPYDRMAIFDGGTPSVSTHRTDFTLPLATGMGGQLMDPRLGLIPTTPITVLSLIGLMTLARRDLLPALYIGSTSLALFLFYSKYKWWVASHHGNRFLIPVVVLATIPLATLVDALADRFRQRYGTPSSSHDETRKRDGAEAPPY